MITHFLFKLVTLICFMGVLFTAFGAVLLIYLNIPKTYLGKYHFPHLIAYAEALRDKI